MLVVAVDESEESLAAFEWTLRHLFREGDRVRLLHVLPLVKERPAPGAVYYAPPLASVDFEYEAHAADAAQEHIQRMYLPVAERFAAADCRLDLVKAGSQGVAPALCRRAEELQAAVLVLHNHRRTALQTALLGSVSTFCATHCARPVLLVH